MNSLRAYNPARFASTSASTIALSVHTGSQVNGHGHNPVEPTLGDGSGSIEVMVDGMAKNTFDPGTEVRCESVEPTLGDVNRSLETVVADATLSSRVAAAGVGGSVEPTLGDGNRSMERVAIVVAHPITFGNSGTAVASAGLEGLKENAFPPLQASQ
ncbi:hypothetical protein V6N11_082960 [Hibiscus sabdariffa]|uniref:Uncharacterized protein n=1 Tax=Hibiscus sabdariffa TaxID=183260 RepID=A0ABR2QKL0_9ROSI